MNRSHHTSTGSTDDEERSYRRRGPHAARTLRTKPVPAVAVQSEQPQFLSRVPQKLELTRPPRDMQRRVSAISKEREFATAVRRVDTKPSAVHTLSVNMDHTPPPAAHTPPSVRRVDQRLAHFSGDPISPPSAVDVARKDKPILQVLDEMSASMLVFRQQVLDFSQNQMNSGTAGHVSELSELQKFLSRLIPDVLRIIEACQAISTVKIAEMKQNLSVVVDMTTAIQIFTNSHLNYQPNISTMDLYQWIIVADNLEILAVSKRHFCDLLNEIQNAVDAMLSSKVYTH